MKHLKRIFIWLALVASAFAGVPFQMASTNGISDPRALGNLQAWYDFSDASSLSTTTAQFTGTGTATSATNSTAFTGSSTIFLSELAAGDTVYNNSGTLIGTIQSVTNNTAAVLTANGAVAITGAAYKIQKANPRIILAYDKSGNSSVNVATLPGIAGNYLSAPNSAALQITDDIDIRVKVALASWTAANQALLYKKNVASNLRAYAFANASGSLRFQMSSDGTVNDMAVSTVDLSSLANYSTKWVRVTRQKSSGNVKFYTSDDGVTWTQLGATVVSVTYSFFASTAPLTIGADNTGASNLFVGNIYYADVRNNINDDGTGIQFQANIANISKLATSFTESSSNAATVTVNTSGDLGTCIAGSRDLIQLTAGHQPTLTASSALFDGGNDFMRCAPFSLAQPETVYLNGNQVTWITGTYLLDGGVAQSTMGFLRATSTPQVNLNAGSSVAGNTSFTLGTQAILSGVFNGASSALRVNRGTATTGSAGTGTPNGFTLGASGNPTAASFSAVQANEVLVYSAGHSTAQQDSVVLYSARKWKLTTIAP